MINIHDIHIQSPPGPCKMNLIGIVTKKKQCLQVIGKYNNKTCKKNSAKSTSNRLRLLTK